MRRQAREMALQILFQTEFAPQITVTDLARALTLTTTPQNAQPFEESVLNYAKTLVQGVQDKKETIDQRIQDVSRNWKIDRMASVDRNILRLAVYEMLFATEILEPKIVINEAVEIAKTYGSQESAPFVNGLLDQIIRDERR